MGKVGWWFGWREMDLAAKVWSGSVIPGIEWPGAQRTM